MEWTGRNGMDLTDAAWKHAKRCYPDLGVGVAGGWGGAGTIWRLPNP